MPQTIEAPLTINRPDGATVPMLYIEHGTPATFKASIDSAGFFYTVGPVYSEQYLYAKSGIVGEKGVQAGAPASGNPELAFFTDVDSGLRSGGANILHLVTGGANRVTVTAAGDVGIGTTSPGRKLDVNGTVRATGFEVNESQRMVLNASAGGGKYITQLDSEEGRIVASYNFFVKNPIGESDPAALWVGLDKDNVTYVYFQERPAAAGGKWGGMVTFLRSADAPTSDYGYGYQPMRLWGKNVYVAPQGVMTLREAVIAPRLFFQREAEIQGQPNRVAQLRHRNLSTGAFELPDYYDTAYRPFKSGTELGAIDWNPSNLGVSIQIGATSDEIVFADSQLTSGVRLASLVRGYADKLFVRAGSGTSDASGNATVGLSGFASTPLFLVSCTHTDAGHQANGQAVSATSATVKTFNAAGTPTGNISFNWIAVGVGNP